MGNLLSCFTGQADTARPDEEQQRAAFERLAYGGLSSEEVVERRGSTMVTSPSSVYRSSLGPTLIPPYVEPSSGASSRSSVSQLRRSTRAGPSLMLPLEQKKAKEIRILLLGSGESGKSTIIKQMKIIHQNGYTRDELLVVRPSVYRNIITGIEQVLTALAKLSLEATLTQCRAHIETLRGAEIDPDVDTSLPEAFVDAVNYIWLEAGVKPIFERLSHNSYIYESIPYFFDHVSRIGKPDYVPTVEDVLRARIKTIGISETLFRTGLLTVRMIDIAGQRPERKNWIRMFEGVTTIIFCVSLSEYDQSLAEEPTQNRLLESFQLFQSIVTSRWFVNTSIVLFLNKKDIFQRKITKVPLTDYFPDYTGGRDYNRATDFIKQKFLGLNVNKLQIYPYLTEATDTTNINLVFAAVKETVLANSLKQSGLF